MGDKTWKTALNAKLHMSWSEYQALPQEQKDWLAASPNWHLSDDGKDIVNLSLDLSNKSKGVKSDK
jgi:hypothetical protein